MDGDITAEDLELWEILGDLEASGQVPIIQQTEVPGCSPNTLQAMFDDEFTQTMSNDDYSVCLKEKFGHNIFREKQYDVIRSIIEEKRDNCVVMATGYGKSLCFQFPSVYMSGITLVVVPLISLMQDQVLGLTERNISACYLGTAQPDKSILSKVVAGQYRLVYACPEFLLKCNGRKLLRDLKHKLTMIAIDEAHCVSQWGHDFRTDYRRLGDIRDIVPDVPILACTATANDFVRQDIITMLGLRDPQVIFTGADRPNLEFIIKKKGNEWDDLRPHLQSATGSTIIYVLRKADAEDIAERLIRHGIVTAHYHADVSFKERETILRKFKSDELKVIVATIAFGMGIDKRDVRCVIHYGSSKNMETYYQEVGRAGRDQKHSKVITFFNPDDFGLHDFFLMSEKKKLSGDVLAYQRSLQQKMRNFLFSSQCRRLLLLQYFNDPFVPTPRPQCCDNCDKGLSAKRLSDLYEDVDDAGRHVFTIDAKLVMDAFEVMHNHTMSDVLDFICHKNNKNSAVTAYRFSVHCGRGAFKVKRYWGAIVQQLLDERYLDVVRFDVDDKKWIATITTSKGIAWSHAKPLPALKLVAIGQMYQFFRNKEEAGIAQPPDACGMSSKLPLVAGTRSLNQFGDSVYEQLLHKMRTELAREYECSPYDVCNDCSLHEMAMKKPINLDELKAAHISGFDVECLRKYGPSFVNAIEQLKNEQLNIVNILHRYPMSLHGHRSRPESIPIMRQIMQCQVLGNIACSVNLNALDVRDEMLNLMRRGYTLSRAYLRSLLGITEDIVALVRSKMQPEDFVDYSGIARIKQENAKLTSIDDGDIAAILTYYQVRRHLELVNRPYTDCDDNNQVWNVRALMVRPQLPPQTAIVASPSIDFPHRQQPNGWPYDAAIDESELDAFWDNFEYDVDHSEEDEEESDQQSEEQSDEEIEEVSDEESEVSPSTLRRM